MPLEAISSLALEVKQLTDTGEFTGIASVTGNVDLGDDIVLPGAFTKTIAERGNKVRLMDNHKVRIGLATVTEIPEGLSTVGRINLEKQSGREAFSDLKFYRDHGLPMGMSMGYQPIRFDYDAKGHRLLREVKLFEVTVTELPMNERAQVLTVKSIGDLITKARHSRSEKDEFNAQLAEAELVVSGTLMTGALSSSLGRLLKRADMGKNERIAEALKAIDQFKEVFLGYLPSYLDYMAEAYGDLKEMPEFEEKAGAMISAANKTKLQAIHEHVKSAADMLYPLLGCDADPEEDEMYDDGITSKSTAGNEEKAAPVPDHSAIEGSLDRLRAMFGLAA